MENEVQLNLELPHIPDIETVAILALDKLGIYWDISEEKRSEARIILSEAIINALEHSGGANPAARISFKLTKEKLVIKVQDFGKGFEPAMIENPDIEKKLFSNHKRGWGLKLMESMSDDFSIHSSPEGTVITMIKNL